MYFSKTEGCEKVGRAMNLPPTAVLCVYVVLGSFVLSPSLVKVPGTNWFEPVLALLTVSMPTGSGKATLFRHLYTMMQEIRVMCGVTDEEPTWVFDDTTFEKMGVLMSENSCRLLCFYDEMSGFLTQIISTVDVACPIPMNCHSFYSSTMHTHGEGTQVSRLIHAETIT